MPIETDLQEFEVLFELCGDRCAYCWDEFTGTPTLDHVIPISHPNSTNHISNFQLVCKTCNAGKRDKPLLAFYKDNPRFQKANLDGVIKIYAYFAKKSIEEIEEMFQRDYEEWKKSKSVASI
ncbi:HNH endonuclease [Oceanobacillus picturae]|uniref:HNH endonuclease n=1 Tax=Oceanobacillus picturae TaxID=171693 RepID=UPI00187CB6A0|nr:HNH endonuclease [Oceanobacillus picturae]